MVNIGKRSEYCITLYNFAVLNKLSLHARSLSFIVMSFMADEVCKILAR